MRFQAVDTSTPETVEWIVRSRTVAELEVIVKLRLARLQQIFKLCSVCTKPRTPRVGLGIPECTNFEFKTGEMEASSIASGAAQESNQGWRELENCLRRTTPGSETDLLRPERRVFEPEDFLIAFKLALTDAANDVGIPPGPERNDHLSRLVSACIEEFYRYPSNGAGATGADNQELSAGGA